MTSDGRIFPVRTTVVHPIVVAVSPHENAPARKFAGAFVVVRGSAKVASAPCDGNDPCDSSRPVADQRPCLATASAAAFAASGSRYSPPRLIGLRSASKIGRAHV